MWCEIDLLEAYIFYTRYTFAHCWLVRTHVSTYYVHKMLGRIIFMNFWVWTFFGLIIDMSEWNWTKRVTQHRMTCDNENSLSSIIADFIIISFGVQMQWWAWAWAWACVVYYICSFVHSFARWPICLSRQNACSFLYIEWSEIIYWFIMSGSIKHMGESMSEKAKIDIDISSSRILKPN